MHDNYESGGRGQVGGHDVVAANLLSNVTLLFSVRAKQGEKQKGENSLTIATRT